ncbi:helix-turn-helix domain-containing protein [Halogeometricum luteum]|uniref:Helix-turn-helix domain-containing protein n=1 Tax=Halogeometricum luteum TaxID=2950537 RepID=A0ABU2G4M5_9EURY|nr:helix-turn-helix domain-containing protein [Halogeometricum sp. S3BR5-2]MDS0295739.1 helix-turn-helix domain-containing protein [Halogeometricum sp. S3BR5-2]
MSITAKIHIRHDRLALVPTLRALDDIKIRVISQGTTNPGTTVFPFLVECDDRASLERALDDDPTVASYKLVDWEDGSGIYYIEHADGTKLISAVVTDVNGFLAHTETKGNGWLVRLLLPDKEALNSVWQYARENDISLEIIEIYGNESAGGESSYGLTLEQRVALRTAYQKGHFQEPRDMSLTEVAEEMGLSSTAMSGRLRRGMRNLIAATIAEPKDEE